MSLSEFRSTVKVLLLRVHGSYQDQYRRREIGFILKKPDDQGLVQVRNLD